MRIEIERDWEIIRKRYGKNNTNFMSIPTSYPYGGSPDGSHGQEMKTEMV